MRIYQIDFDLQRRLDQADASDTRGHESAMAHPHRNRVLASQALDTAYVITVLVGHHDRGKAVRRHAQTVKTTFGFPQRQPAIEQNAGHRCRFDTLNHQGIALAA